MAYPRYLRDKARALRTERCLTLDEIAERLALPRSTVFYWIRDLPLGRPRRASAGQRKGNAAMSATFRRRRQAAYRQGQLEYPELAAQRTFRDFVVLYVAEGYKRNRNVVSLCNSDPRVIAIAARWIGTLSERKLDYSLQYHADQDPEQLRTFWGAVLGVDAQVIRLQRKSNSAQLRRRSWRSVHGVLTVGANDTMLRARLQAWIDRVKEDWR